MTDNQPADLVTPAAERVADATPMLRLRDVHKSFGGLKVLDGVDLEVPRGGITGLIGPNGSGKSTLFDIITAYLAADEGQIDFNGESLLGLSPHKVSRRGLIRTFQLTRVFPNLTVAENLLVFGGRDRARGDAKARELLDFVGLIRLADHEAAGLSYGQQKLLEIAQVLMLDPMMLMLDEPMAGINPGLADEIVQRLRDLREAGMTILIVEHNLPVVVSMCDKVAVLNGGRVMLHATPDVVVNDPEVREAFLGD